MAARPLVVVIAGPNGAGKSTTAPRLLAGALQVNEFVNADTIARGLSGLRPETAGIAAGRVMLARLRWLASERRDFAFATTLVSKTFAPWLRRLRAAGYRTHILFLSLPTPDLAVARVAERVRAGGHDVPEDVIRRRFVGGLRNFFGLYLPIAHAWQVMDNSDTRVQRWVASGSDDNRVRIHDRRAWASLQALSR